MRVNCWKNGVTKMSSTILFVAAVGRPPHFLREVESSGFLPKAATLENLVFELKSHPPLSSLASFRDGWFYIQDPGTLLAVCKLGPQPGETILDFCAAPGGKTTFIAQLMNNQGRIVAQDVSEERLKWIQENCARLGVTCVETSFTLNPQPSNSSTSFRPRSGGRAVLEHRRDAPPRGFALADPAGRNRTPPHRATGFAPASRDTGETRRRSGL